MKCGGTDDAQTHNPNGVQLSEVSVCTDLNQLAALKWKQAEIERTLVMSENLDLTGVELIIKCRVHRRRVQIPKGFKCQ